MSEVKTYAVNCNDAWLNTDGDDISGSYVKYADYIVLVTKLDLAERACAALERLRTIVADPCALPRRKEWISGQQYSYVLLENVEAMVDEACRAAMLQRSEPVTDNTNQQFESLAKSE